LCLVTAPVVALINNSERPSATSSPHPALFLTTTSPFLVASNQFVLFERSALSILLATKLNNTVQYRALVFAVKPENVLVFRHPESHPSKDSATSASEALALRTHYREELWAASKIAHTTPQVRY
jgi:hypothetical protein